MLKMNKKDKEAYEKLEKEQEKQNEAIDKLLAGFDPKTRGLHEMGQSLSGALAKGGIKHSITIFPNDVKKGFLQFQWTFKESSETFDFEASWDKDSKSLMSEMNNFVTQMFWIYLERFPKPVFNKIRYIAFCDENQKPITIYDNKEKKVLENDQGTTSDKHVPAGASMGPNEE